MNLSFDPFLQSKLAPTIDDPPPDSVHLANAVVFVASERASWIAGVNLPVDGVQHKGNL